MQVIYSRNGVKITSTPVEHYTTGGPSALRVDWNGLSFVYSGDTHPTRTLNELAEGTDMLIQQIMGPLPAFDSLSFESQYLLNVSFPSSYLPGHCSGYFAARLCMHCNCTAACIL